MQKSEKPRSRKIMSKVRSLVSLLLSLAGDPNSQLSQTFLQISSLPFLHLNKCGARQSRGSRLAKYCNGKGRTGHSITSRCHSLIFLGDNSRPVPFKLFAPAWPVLVIILDLRPINSAQRSQTKLGNRVSSMNSNKRDLRRDLKQLQKGKTFSRSSNHTVQRQKLPKMQDIFFCI